jgi:hypothetical protein
MKDKDIRKNGSGCNDPTAYAAIAKVTKDGKSKNRNRQKDVFDAMHIIKSFLDLIDFEIVGHIKLKDKQTGRIYE